MDLLTAARLRHISIVRVRLIRNLRPLQEPCEEYHKDPLDADGYGLPVEFEITDGEVNDWSAAPDLIAKLPGAQVIVADKGYDSEYIREQITKKGARAVIPRKCNSLKGNADMDWGLYRYRHLVENAFARIKQYRAVATRYDKLKRKSKSMVAMACGYLWLPM